MLSQLGALVLSILFFFGNSSAPALVAQSAMTQESSTTSSTTPPSTTNSAPQDTTPPSVSGFTTSNQTDGTVIGTITFSEPIDTATYSPNNLYPILSSGAKIDGTVYPVSANVASVRVHGPVSGALYQLVAHGVRDLAGNTMPDWMSPAFQLPQTSASGTTTTTTTSTATSTTSSTQSGAGTSLTNTQTTQTTTSGSNITVTASTTTAHDTTPPTISYFGQSTQPDGTIMAGVQFSEAVDPSTVSASTLYMVASLTGQKLSGTALVRSSTGASAQLSSPALFATDYRLVARGIKDLAGNAMPEYISPVFQRSGNPTTVSATAATTSSTAATQLPATATTVIPPAATSAPLPDDSAERTLAPSVAAEPPVTSRQARQLSDLNTSVRTLDHAVQTSAEAPAPNPAPAPSEAKPTPDLSGAGDRALTDTSDDHGSEVQAARAALQERDGPALFEDTDHDGVSDYDEQHIYHTDPDSARTIPGAMTDGEKILRGIDPLSPSAAPVPVQSPKGNGFEVDGLFAVDTIAAVPAAQPELSAAATSSATTTPIAASSTALASSTSERDIEFAGRALPNSFVTLYIFSTPIVVTVKADSAGRWKYRLDKELPDGSHELYVAMVDNSGAIIAKSPPVPFTKTAEALDYRPLVLPPVDDGDLRSALMIRLGILAGGTILLLAGVVVFGIGMMRRDPPLPTPA